MDHVRIAVIDGTMPPGSWHSVYQLSELLGISRSPVRDALLRLEEAGLVEFVRNRGFRVVETTANDVAEIFGIRLGIEPAAAYRAATAPTISEIAALDSTVAAMYQSANNHDEEEFFSYDRHLHRLIMVAGSAHRGADIIDRLRIHTRILGPSTAGASRSFQDILDEHRPVIEAIRTRDAEGAREAMREHLLTTGLLLLRQSLNERATTEADQTWNKYTSGT